MIISNKHKFIFIKSKKTASESIEFALKNYYVEGDIITHASLETSHVNLKKKFKYYKGFSIKLLPVNIKKFFNYFIYRILFNKKLRKYNLNFKYKLNSHSNALEIKEVVGNKIWQEYYKFCFTRNPYDQILSAFRWDCYKEKKNFENYNLKHLNYYLKKNCKNFFQCELKNYYHKDQFIVDKVFKYENLNEDILYLENKLGLSNFHNLIQLNKIHKIDNQKYISKKDLTIEQIDIINCHAHKIFKLFDYPMINKKNNYF